MNRLDIDLQNCYGIPKLVHSFDLPQGHPIAIYASNGVMKSSFANTFLDHSRGNDSLDRVHPERASARILKAQKGRRVREDEVVAITSFEQEWSKAGSTTRLMVDPTLQEEYNAVIGHLNTLNDNLRTSLQRSTRRRSGVFEDISRCFDFTDETFQDGLTGLRESSQAIDQDRYIGIPYSDVFSKEARELLNDATVRESIGSYMRALDELLETSRYLRRTDFNLYAAQTVSKALKANGYFDSGHALLFRDKQGELETFKDLTQLEEMLEEEVQRIATDEALQKSLQEIGRKLDGKAQTRSLQKFILSRGDLIEELSDIEALERKYWLAHLSSCQDTFEAFTVHYLDSRATLSDIERKAADQRTQWDSVIDEFNRRFSAPFTVKSKNKAGMVLGIEETGQFEFKYAGRPIAEDELLRVLSTGERKAFYILNILYEFESRKHLDHTTLFVIDDIADSFDYKNKYAIIQYLGEMAKVGNFRLIILTHNFDFLRTIVGRKIVGSSRCFRALRESESIRITSFTDGEVENYFSRAIKGQMFCSGPHRIAAIAFARNLVEYTLGTKSDAYEDLTNLLHRKSQTDSVLQSDLDQILRSIFPLGKDDLPQVWNGEDEPVIDHILREATGLFNQKTELDLAGKIALSIAIRLQCEQYVFDSLPSAREQVKDKPNQTRNLVSIYRKAFPDRGEENQTLMEVLLMTSENIHINAFMYEPIVDLSDSHLRQLFGRVQSLIEAHSDRELASS